MSNAEIKTVAVMKNKVWITKEDGDFEETQIHLNDEEVLSLISSISKEVGIELNEKNPLFSDCTPNGFITHIVMPPITRDKPVVTIYRDDETQHVRLY